MPIQIPHKFIGSCLHICDIKYLLFISIKGLQNWDFFELAAEYETGRFWEGSETQISKPKLDFEVRILGKGPKTCKISPELAENLRIWVLVLEIGFRSLYNDFFAKFWTPKLAK
jgi:hypothetical protein